MLVVTMGPTGAGKTQLANVILESWDQNPNTATRYVVDDLVESSARYKSAVREILRDIRQSCASRECLGPALASRATSFAQAYFDARIRPPCHEDTTLSCDDLVDNAVMQHPEREPVVVFETTGAYGTLDWLLERVPQNWIVVVAVAVAPLDQLMARNVQRAVDAFEAFEQNPDQPAPRMPDVQPDVLVPLLYRIADNAQALSQHVSEFFHLLVVQDGISLEIKDDVRSTVLRAFRLPTNGGSRRRSRRRPSRRRPSRPSRPSRFVAVKKRTPQRAR